jgi:hypothetical protein
MSRIVHVQTIVQTVFGVLDDDGNVIPQQPIVAQSSKFSAYAFTEAYAAIAAERDKAAAAYDAEQPNPPGSETGGRRQRRPTVRDAKIAT